MFDKNKKRGMTTIGNNFGLNDNYLYTEYEFDSLDCNTPYNPNYSIRNWPNFLLGKPLDNVAAIKVLEATIPFTYYVINQKNREFYLMETLDDTNPFAWSILLPIILDVGTYTPATLANALEGLMNSVTLNAFTYEVSFDTVTQKFIFDATNVNGIKNFKFQFGGVLESQNNYSALVLGFMSEQEIVGSLDPTSTFKQVRAPYVARLNGPPYLYLNSTSLGGVFNLYLPGNGLVNPSIGGANGPQITKIPVNSEFGGFIHYKDPDPQKWFYMANLTISGAIDFYFTAGTSENNSVLDLNGGRFSIKLGVLQTRDQVNNNMPGTYSSGRVTARTRPRNF